jgi:hypothetical protein
MRSGRADKGLDWAGLGSAVRSPRAELLAHANPDDQDRSRLSRTNALGSRWKPSCPVPFRSGRYWQGTRQMTATESTIILDAAGCGES